MDSFVMQMLHFFMLEYMLRNGMNETADAFGREADIRDPPSWLNLPDGFLSDLWCDFWDSHIWEHDRGSEVMEEESSSQAEARAQAQAQAQDQAVTIAAHGYVHAQTQPQTQVSWAFANNENIIYQPIQSYTYNVTIVSRTTLIVEQHSVVRHYVNLDVQHGSAFRDHSSNLGHNMSQSSQGSLHQVPPTPTTPPQPPPPTTTEHVTPEPFDLNADFEDFNGQ